MPNHWSRTYEVIKPRNDEFDAVSSRKQRLVWKLLELAEAEKDLAQKLTLQQTRTGREIAGKYEKRQ